MVRHKSVPSGWQQSNGGPYVRHTDGYWYYVSPFNPTPWAVAQQPTPLPPGFLEMFGAEPVGDIGIKTKWHQDLALFVRAGAPHWISPAVRSQADKVCQGWGMGAGRYYVSTRADLVRFPNSAIASFEVAAHLMATHPHIVVAMYQLECANLGIRVEKVHPFVRLPGREA